MKSQPLFIILLLFFSSSIAVAQLPQPSIPLACNSANCTPPVSETCTGTSTIVTNFTNATLRSGSPTSLPAVYTFYNVATISGVQVNATVTINSQLNCNMAGANFAIDDDAATDQSGNSIASFFAPRITGSGTFGTTDRRGYVEFTLRFFIENGTAGQQYTGAPGDDYSTPPPSGISGLNYIHYDIDGSTQGTGGWFRETGVVQDVTGSTINGDVSTELSPYSYTDGSFNWKGFAGSVCERNGVSRCAQVAAAANYSAAQSFITVRMGYDYNYTTTTMGTPPTRQYGSRFGCFSFPQLTPLPVKLLNFSGYYKNSSAVLDWQAENQFNFSGYAIERSTNGTLFIPVVFKNNTADGLGKESYNYADDLSGISDEVFYYRLKMIDKDGRYSYSNIIAIRKVEKVTAITIMPNPVTATDFATVRLSASSNGLAAVRVVDISGRLVQAKQVRLVAGVNNITITDLAKLQPGAYFVHVSEGVKTDIVKFFITR
jgi:hypothetical protein